MAIDRVRLQREGAVAAHVEQGYQAYRSGAYALAERHYRAQLASEPANRDALLGLAAIALKQGRPEQARERYRRLLAANPADGAVEVALLSLAGDGETELREGRLKALLETTAGAEAAAALGQLMADQQRWQEARSYYALASRAAPRQADLAYDLAVSLDALGERRQAALGYAAALALPAQGRSFDPAAARARQLALEALP
ncbi:tetratricopeptide repeat protein [Chitinimonas koreensis]|uniref:tetratricopeptide repeat protein n=1 Tax=Chitinimonas koreensis TaxID=356302 RepID=UPI00048D8A6A|nr:tetratricopeptide repeat protein [Chitinimonas koreensis]QNM96324.1 tetratricopeptide repeat protein [Chitinimonas koreensis]